MTKRKEQQLNDRLERSEIRTVARRLASQFPHATTYDENLSQAIQNEADIIAHKHCRYHLPPATTLARKYLPVMRRLIEEDDLNPTPRPARELSGLNVCQNLPTNTEYFRKNSGTRAFNRKSDRVARIHFKSLNCPEQTFSPRDRATTCHETGHEFFRSEFYTEDLAIRTLHQMGDNDAIEEKVRRRLVSGNFHVRNPNHKHDWQIYKLGTLNGFAALRGTDAHTSILDRINRSWIISLTNKRIINNWNRTTEEKARTWAHVYTAVGELRTLELESSALRTQARREELQASHISMRDLSGTLGFENGDEREEITMLEAVEQLRTRLNE
ncbi:hypothetical protein ACFLX2_00140 [Candidatus Dependentiae bacterium]